MKIFIITLLVLVGMLMYTIIAAPKSDYEQRLDDESQIEYIREYINKKNK